jgi:LacI family transcriptional regulator
MSSPADHDPFRAACIDVPTGANVFAMKPRVTLADIAKVAGVSKAAVSLALNDHAQVSETLRAEVKALAAKMGYRHDPALSLIAASRWRTPKASPGSVLAMISLPRIAPEKPARVKKAPAPEGIEWKAAQARAETLGYKLEPFDASHYASPEKLATVLRNRGIRGVVIEQIYDVNFIDQFDWSSFAAVAIHDGYVQPPVEQFTPSYVHALRECWTRALAAGYRRPALALFHEMREHYINFIVPAAWIKLEESLPAKQRIPVHYFDPADRPAFGAWIKKNHPDIVIGFNDTHYWALRDLGLSIPGDLACSSMQRVSTDTNPIAGVSANSRLLGIHAIERLDALLRHAQYGPPESPVVHRIIGDWRDAESMPPRV